MPLTSDITPYDDSWPYKFGREAERLKPIFGQRLQAFHHIGSTAVPGLASKPEIDMLALVSHSNDLGVWTDLLAQSGYRRGGDLSGGHHFFKRDVNGLRTHKLHVCNAEHPSALRMLKIRDHLRASNEDRDAYQAMKLRLERENRFGITEYLEGKAPFLDSLYRKIDKPG